MKGTMTTLILPPKILLTENDPATADQIRAALAGAGNGSFDVEWVRQLSEGLARLSKKGIAAILLELSLPDSLTGSRSGAVGLSRAQRAVNGVASLLSEYGFEALAIAI